MKNPSVLTVIPARSGSKRIPSKNIRLFAGKPLIVHTIRQAKKIPFIGRIIVDTDSKQIATLARHESAEVPFLRPKRLAGDTSQVADSLRHLLMRLKSNEGYVPDYVLILQATSPLRKLSDITACWRAMKKGGATTVLTVTPTHPRLYHIRRGFIALVNGSEKDSTNMQAWESAYILNGCFAYIVKTAAFLKEGRIITKKTRPVICPKWRSVDLDTPEDWALAEHLFKNRGAIETAIRKIGRAHAIKTI
ncbi:acylneuraminate cytidylyltransferase family protein [Candidatus Kaiserbacteria bacterium]|nr:acylneuraminate cytidylyltransferase family protein [Candidatus Kaiserbacteria bacterium]